MCSQGVKEVETLFKSIIKSTSKAPRIFHFSNFSANAEIDNEIGKLIYWLLSWRINLQIILLWFFIKARLGYDSDGLVIRNEFEGIVKKDQIELHFEVKTSPSPRSEITGFHLLVP